MPLLVPSLVVAIGSFSVAGVPGSDGFQALLRYGLPAALFLAVLAVFTVSLVRERRRVRQALERRRIRMEAVLSVLPDQGLVLDEDGVCLDLLNRTGDASRADAIPPGRSVRDVYPAPAAEVVLETLRWARVTGQPQHCDFTLPDAAGGSRIFEARMNRLPPDAGSARAPALVMLSRDITARWLDGKKRADNLETYRALFHRSADALVVLDMDGRPRMANEAALRLFANGAEGRLPELRALFADGSGDAYRLFMSLLLRAGQAALEERFTLGDGTVFEGEIRATVLAQQEQHEVLARIRDLRPVRQRVIRARLGAKMKGIRKLARSLAHDSNNMLVGILGGANLLRATAVDAPSWTGPLARIEQAGERITERTRQLSLLASHTRGMPEPVEVAEVVRKAVEAIRLSAPASLRIEVADSTAPARVEGSPNLIQQMIGHLAANGREAMPEGGTLRFEVASIDLGPDACAGHAGCRGPGSYVRVRVSDTGRGIPAAVRERLFEPFVTLKTPGQGAGLGLAMVFEGCRDHGGFVDVATWPKAGTSVSLYLPRFEEVQSPRDDGRPEARGKRQILLVDDEPRALEATRRLLEGLGYSAAIAVRGSEALAWYREHWREMDLAMLDMVLPDMEGLACFRAMKAIHPGVRAVLCSGFSAEAQKEKCLAAGMLGTLQKPYSMDRLERELRRLLETEVP